MKSSALAKFTNRISTAVKAWRFPGNFGSNSQVVFWPNWPAQCPVVTLNEGTWDESSLVMSAVNWTGTVFGEPIISVLRRNKDQTWTKVQHPMTRLWEMPNPYYTGATMLKAFAYYWIVYGNVYIGKRRDDDGRLRELYLLPTETIEPRWPDDGSEFISHYEIKVDGIPMRIEKRDLIHFRYGLDPRNHRIGLSPLRALIEEVMTDESAISYSNTVLANTGVPPFIVSPKPNADNEYTFDAESTNAELVERTQGSNKGKPIVFSHPLTVDVLGSIKPSEMALEQMHDLPEERLAAVLGIPGLVLGYGFDDHATYSNYKTALDAAWNTYVIPTLRLIATEITRQLLPEWNGRNSDEWVEFDTSEIWALQGDQNQIADRERKNFLAGLVTRNEARAAMGMKPIDGGDDLVETAQSSLLTSREVTKAMSGDQYDELREWWKEFGPKDAQGILDAEVIR